MHKKILSSDLIIPKYEVNLLSLQIIANHDWHNQIRISVDYENQ